MEFITMFSKRFILLYLMGVLCIFVCVGSSHTRKCIVKDRQALLKLKDGFVDEWGILSSWKGEDCCKWKGVSCNNLTGHVTRLDLQSLDSSSLGGKIDASICELQYLTSLNVSSNNLDGKIPECIGTLGQLIELGLSSNIFDGVIPPTLGNLSKLHVLDIGYNYFLAANNLEWISYLSNLRYIDLSFINLGRASDWLSSISHIPSLSNLYLDECGVHQVNPKFIVHINFSSSLKFLSLSGNNLSSSIPLWLLNVSKVLTHLDLSHNYFQKSFPDGFANMMSLQYLDLSNNELEGSIPKSFQNLCQLKWLKLQSNKFSGQVSDYIQQLCSAQMLDLSHNPFESGPFPGITRFSSSLKKLLLQNTNLVGTLPKTFGHLPNLVDLDLSFNQLSGSLQFLEVSKLPSLEDLDLSYNQLNGTLPCAIGKFSKLERLSLSYNKLNGVISEAHLSNLSRLQILNVAQNSLLFNLTSNWVPPFRLIRLFASSCTLGPKFPTWLKHLRELEILDISNSGISDTFPKWFWDLSPELYYLNVSHNHLSGAFPKSLPTMMQVVNIWDFSFNNLSGPLPHFPELYALFVSNNMLSGSISSFCGTPPLVLSYLDLSSNLLEGPLPDCWGKFQHLQVLDLSNNNLFGEIPKSFGTLQQIETMHLNNNNFFGEIPNFTNCTKLTFIDFGDNNLRGMLPAWIGHNLSKLILLRLRANKFQGTIPTSLCKLSSLQVLDLSSNNITGEIPQCLGHITALSKMNFPRINYFYFSILPVLIDEIDRNLFIDKAILVWKGGDREYGKILGLLTIIDLSNNHLIGEMPQSMSTLVALASLNLSTNNLTGSIPNNIGHMKMLESLDLSKNHLHGRMPSSFSKLSFLSYMNLSFNNLSGKIPTSTQLQSFDPSSYEGNNGLCGPPLTNPCPGDTISPTGSTYKKDTDENENEDEFITFGFYITLGIGFIVGFWGVCGTLIIKSSWRYAYFRFFNNIYDWIYVKLVIFIARMKRRIQIQD